MTNDLFRHEKKAIFYIYISFWIYKQKSELKCVFSCFWKKKKGLTHFSLRDMI